MKRASKLFADRLNDPRRARDARDRLIPDVAGDGVARADVIIEAIFENVDAKRSLFASLEKKAKPDAILATQYVEHSARGDRRRRSPIRRGSSACTSSIRSRA